MCFLLNHGYLPDIENDFVPLNVLSSDGSLLYIPIIQDYTNDDNIKPSLLQVKYDILFQNQLGWVILQCKVTMTNIGTRNIRLGPSTLSESLTIFRFLCASQNTVDQIIEEKSLDVIHHKISPSNENCAVSSLTELLENSLSAYPNSLMVSYLSICCRVYHNFFYFVDGWTIAQKSKKW